MTPLVQVRDLSRTFAGRRGTVRRAVDRVSFDIGARETLGLVGESGCGKTTLARCLLHLTAPGSGRVLFDGTDVTATLRSGSAAQRLRLRSAMQYVFQDARPALDPRWTVAQSVAEPLRVHHRLPPAEWPARIASLLAQTGLDAGHGARYPHELSGGQLQRAGLARALAAEPRLLVCDEPVSSLDMSLRAQILNLLCDLQDRLGLTYLYISHDLASVRSVSHRAGVMYLGRIVEMGPADALFTTPLHPYTAALLAAVPAPDPDAPGARYMAAGEPPSLDHPPSGCHFHPRCPAARGLCREAAPVLSEHGTGHSVACHYPLG